jgi:large subunit ribosomal protein L25
MSVALKAETGREIGSRSTGRLRREGQIPAVVYGQGVGPISVAVDARELRGVLNTGDGQKVDIDLSVDGTKYKVRAHQLQKHPVRRTVVHVDFLVQPKS